MLLEQYLAGAFHLLLTSKVLSSNKKFTETQNKLHEKLVFWPGQNFYLSVLSFALFTLHITSQIAYNATISSSQMSYYNGRLEPWSSFSNLTVITNAPFHFEKPLLAWKSQVIIPHRREAMLDAKMNPLFSWVLNEHKARALCSNMQSLSQEQWHERSPHFECGNGRKPSATRGPYEAVWKATKNSTHADTWLWQVCTNDWKISNPFHATLFSPGQQDVTNKYAAVLKRERMSCHYSLPRNRCAAWTSSGDRKSVV